MTRFPTPPIVNKTTRRPTADVIAHLIDSGPYVEDSLGRVRDTFRFHVTVDVGGPEVRRALAASAKGIPTIGSAHPAVPTTFVTQIESQAVDDTVTQFLVTVEYGPPGQVERDPFDNEPGEDQPAQLTITTTLQEVLTTRDVLGNEITVVGFQPVTSDADEFGFDTSKQVTQAAQVRTFKAFETVIFRRRELRNPHFKSRLFTSTVNATEVFDDPARFWLCTRLDGVTDDGGQTFNVTYEFQRNTDTWDATVIFTDPRTGQPPLAMFAANGSIKPAWSEAKKTGIQLYEAREFRDLNLVL